MPYIEIVEIEESFELPIGDSIIVCRRFDTEVYKNIEKKHTKKSKNQRTGVIFADTDDHAINSDLLDYMIIGWRGVKSPLTGGDVPCTRENKLKLPSAAKVLIIEACDANSVSGSEKKVESGITL